MSLQQFWRDQRGATAIEYGLIAALVALAVIAGVRGVGTTLSGRFAVLSDNVK